MKLKLNLTNFSKLLSVQNEGYTTEFGTIIFV
jgi:hypothetical protein